MVDFAGILFILLQCYFLLMNFTVERIYCHEPLTRSDDRFLMRETWEFSESYNPLFLSRPEWMRQATCISSYGLSLGYLVMLIIAVTGTWARFKTPVSMFLGAKAYALLFYHLMEFTSATPPPEIVPYFAVEGPYLLAMAIALYKVSFSKAVKQHSD